MPTTSAKEESAELQSLGAVEGLAGSLDPGAWSGPWVRRCGGGPVTRSAATTPATPAPTMATMTPFRRGDEPDGGEGEHGELPQVPQGQAERNDGAGDGADDGGSSAGEERLDGGVGPDAIEAGTAIQHEEERRLKATSVASSPPPTPLAA